VRSSVSIALFFLLSAFFLFALLAALQHSGKALGIALGCLVALALLIVFLTPVRLPVWFPLKHNKATTTTVTAGTTTTITASTTTSSPLGTTTTTLAGVTTTTSAAGTATTGAAR
jgi:hypothetical protein